MNLVKRNIIVCTILDLFVPINYALARMIIFGILPELLVVSLLTYSFIIILIN